MKAIISIRFKQPDGKRYDGTSDIIEWDLPIPKKRDIIYIQEGQSALKMNYFDKESEDAINGNAFEYKYKIYSYEDDERILTFMFK